MNYIMTIITDDGVGGIETLTNDSSLRTSIDQLNDPGISMVEFGNIIDGKLFEGYLIAKHKVNLIKVNPVSSKNESEVLSLYENFKLSLSTGEVSTL